MSGYLSSRKLTNVKGRINYITNEKKQENIIDYHKEYLDELAKIIWYFVKQDSFTEKYCILDGWLEDYKNELDLIKETIDEC